jgi:molybdenum cofactor synthesis domain-containing protein
MNIPEKLDILIITMSDRASSGEYEDLSGPKIKELLSEFLDKESWRNSIDITLIPDEAVMLSDLLIKYSLDKNVIITTGGTGIGPRDVTVETVTPLLNKQIPGVMEYIRVKYGADNPGALLSRGVAGVIGKALVYTLPGSVKAVQEYMTEILKTLKHTVYMQYGIDVHEKPSR